MSGVLAFSVTLFVLFCCSCCSCWLIDCSAEDAPTAWYVLSKGPTPELHPNCSLTSNSSGRSLLPASQIFLHTLPCVLPASLDPSLELPFIGLLSFSALLMPYLSSFFFLWH